jgi:hypothetical protein
MEVEEEGEDDEEEGEGEGAGGEAAAGAAGAAAGEEREDFGADGEGGMLPLLEHTSSHLLFKRLLAREARPGDRAVPGRAPAPAAPAEPAAATFGPLLAGALRGRLLPALNSNRAAFIVAELMGSSDKAVRAAVRAELTGAAALKALRALPKSSGIDLLLSKLAADA